VHLIAVATRDFEITAGADALQMTPGYGRMTHTFCSRCGSGIYQHPRDASFRALFPSTFAGGDRTQLRLPAHLAPTQHSNYESRLFDWTDDLPKYIGWRTRCSNDGVPLLDGAVS
jgi:hypothetical protein